MQNETMTYKQSVYDIFQPGSEVQVLIRNNVKKENFEETLKSLKVLFKKNPIISGSGMYDYRVKVSNTRTELDKHTNNYNIYAVGVVL